MINSFLWGQDGASPLGFCAIPRRARKIHVLDMSPQVLCQALLRLGNECVDPKGVDGFEEANPSNSCTEFVSIRDYINMRTGRLV